MTFFVTSLKTKKNASLNLVTFGKVDWSCIDVDVKGAKAISVRSRTPFVSQ